MSRRKKNIKKEILEDPKYKNIIVSKFINILMLHGKKTIAEKIAQKLISLGALIFVAYGPQIDQNYISGNSTKNAPTSRVHN